MVKHNNVIPNQHFKKDWQNRVKTWFDQPARKQRRRLARKAKAVAIAPRPVSGPLRPVVRCPTVKYNTKLRAGRGFTLYELREAGINTKEARGLGIAVDHRRRNKSTESLQSNVARLQAYRARLIVFPRNHLQKPKNGDSSPEETAVATQVAGDFPISQSTPVVETMEITEALKNSKVRQQQAQARLDKRMAGLREKRAKEAAEKAANKKKK